MVVVVVVVVVVAAAAVGRGGEGIQRCILISEWYITCRIIQTGWVVR